MTTEREWITGRDLAVLLGRPARLDMLLRDYLKVGMISARAKAATLIERGNRAAFVSPRSVKRDWEVPSSVWEAASHESMFDLLHGKFTTTRTGMKDIARVELVGVSFDKNEALDALELEATTARAVEQVKTSNAGAKTDKARWAAFAGAFAAAVYKGDVDPETDNSAQSIYKRVSHAMSEAGDDNPLGLDSVRPAITTFLREARTD